MAGEPYPPQGAQYEFAGRLEALHRDPVEAVTALKSGLQLTDLDVRLGLTRELSLPADGGLSEGPLRTIDTVRRLVILFSRHGIIGPQQQGLWLAERNKELWFADETKSPLAILRLGAQVTGPTKNNIWRVFNASQTFLRPSNEGIDEAWDIIYGGTGDFSIPMHRH